jgi:hyaluronan synthase
MSSTPVLKPRLISLNRDLARRLPECDRTGLHPAGDVWDQVLSVAVVLALAILAYAAVRSSLFRPLILEAENYRWARLIVRPSILWGTMGTALLAFRTILWFRYRSSPPATMADAPSLTVIIPAYNEGEMVLRSIESVAQAPYPRDRLQLLVIDDGSSDDTWTHIQKAARRYPDLVVAQRLPENRGKRAALAVGFEHARGEIVVTLDSDSVIEVDALLAITGPFRNAAVGAVAGKVKVYNRRAGLIPRMLHVRYALAFDLLRASESGYGTVYCCPGALTAYRMSVVRQVLSRWLEQKFLGVPCTVGEDRALTNLILSSGCNTVYQGSAVVHTVTPVTYGKLCRMLLRWDRSYVREEVQFLRIVWTRPLGVRVIALFDRIITNLRYPVHYACLALLCVVLPHHPLTMVRLAIVVGVVSLLNMLYYLRSERSPDFLYGILYSYFSLIGLFWIFPFAVLTVRSRSWLTR